MWFNIWMCQWHFKCSFGNESFHSTFRFHFFTYPLSLIFLWFDLFGMERFWAYHIFTVDAELIAWWFSYDNFEITIWILNLDFCMVYRAVKIIIKRIKWFGWILAWYMRLAYYVYLQMLLLNCREFGYNVKICYM